MQRPTPSQSCAASATPLSIATSRDFLLKSLSSHPATTRPAFLPDSLSVPTPGLESPASKPGPTTSSRRLPRPRITSQGWNVEELCSKFENFKPVRRAHACSESLAATLLGYERDGIPLIVDHWDEHPAWPQDIFSLEWLLRTSGEKQISTRNVHDRRDHSMTLREFVDISRKQSRHSVAGESQRLYWKDADCPLEWRKWLLHSGAVPANVLPGVVNPDDYLGYLSESEAVESLLCYMGIGDTYTAAHKDLCASSGHNLMCFSEQGGSSYWFMTAANDAPAVAAYFHRELRQELDWETHVTTVEELGRAPFKVYIAEQKVGDLVLVPPRSCHQVVNHGGLAMKTSWSRMTLDNLTTAIRYELPIYRRVCRPEQYRVKTILYRSVLHLTEQLQKALAFVPQPALKAEPRDPTPTANADTVDRAKKLRRLVQLFDEVLREEFARCYTELDHIFRSEGSIGWGLTSGLTPSAGNDSGRPGSSSLSNGFKLRPQLPADVEDRRNSDRARERTASCNLACDFCGADIFQSFFECQSCRTPEEGTTPSIGDGLLICPSCYVEGRACHCSDMEPRQCRPFEMLLSDRNDAAHVLSRV
ncbi:hypothetical protein BD413DRAFT_463733, partial [Trametes elegans]